MAFFMANDELLNVIFFVLGIVLVVGVVAVLSVKVAHSRRESKQKVTEKVNISLQKDAPVTLSASGSYRLEFDGQVHLSVNGETVLHNNGDVLELSQGDVLCADADVQLIAL